MRVAMVMDAWNPILWGGPIHVLNLSRRLIEDHGCEVDLFVRSLRSETGEIFDSDEMLCDWKMKVFRCGRPRPFFQFSERIFSIFSMVRRIVSEHRKSPYDAIHAHVYLWVLSWKIASIVLGIPIVVTCHWTQILDKGVKNFEYFVERLILTQIPYDLIITVWSSLFRYPNVNQNVVLIGNGVNAEEFQFSGTKNAQGYKILFVWRLDEFKGVHILIAAAVLIWGEYLQRKNVQICLVGFGYEREKYERIVQENHLEDVILFLGKKTWVELAQEYSSSDLFVLPSLSEWFGIVILEAMASGVPVIATKSGWPEDIIRNWINWFLVEKWNPSQLADLMKKFIDNQIPDIDVVIENARCTVLNEYTWKSIADRTYQEYSKLLLKGGS